MTQAAAVSLDDKYALDTTRAYMTGIEALVRLPILQHQRDLEAGLNTAGFISGYRGSPLGALDQSLWQARPYLDKHHIRFQPGVNEDLAATAVWGSQQVNLFPGANYDGVFGMWYGKGPGVDRSMDAIRHANAFGTSRYGGVLAIAGDDHACKSSTLPHQTEHMFIGASMPILCPANVQEVLDLGIFGWELSRYSGCWVALKAITENMDSAISAEVDPGRVRISIPHPMDLPREGLNARWPVKPLEQERLLNKYRIYAARAFARSNNLNPIVIQGERDRLGIITTGKAYLDVMQALEDLGIDESLARQIGIRVYKVGMSWPLEPLGTHEFAEGLEEILVVEEKRSIIEDQLTGQLYNWPVRERPRVVGEFDEQGRDLLPNFGELTPARVARAIAERIRRFYHSDLIDRRLAFLNAKEQRLAQPRSGIERQPHYCSGCPHNTSTKVPEGSVAFAGIGCHYMAQWIDGNTLTTTQMGGEGAVWIGQAPFTETGHVFQNLGDGTYFHSGLLAIRATIAAGVNITFKILFNDAVAMTGGQPIDGQLTVPMLVQQLRAEGVQRIAVVADDPGKYPLDFPVYQGVTIDHRRDYDAVQDAMRSEAGTSVLIYDQTCAAEKRRRRKRGELEDPQRRVFINEAVCEGCGDCSVKSNCLSVLPVATELGLKRRIDQHACNKDYTCLEGFCPAMVTVTGGRLKAGKFAAVAPPLPALPEPELPGLERPWNILVAGIGGSGILTAGAILAMAAHIEGKGCSTLNQTGLAQKFGAVTSHIRIGARQQDIYAVRIPAGDADLLLGADLVVAASLESLAKLDRGRSHAVVNDHEAVTAAFIRDPQAEFPAAAMKDSITAEVGEGKTRFTDASGLMQALLGNAMGANLFLLGYAYQSALVPVAAASIEAAIRLNDVEVEANIRAFNWGRQAAHDPARVDALAQSPGSAGDPLTDLQGIIDWRSEFLREYQDAAYMDRYRHLVGSVWRVEQDLDITDSEEAYPLTRAVAQNFFKLMAYKDEYEVARLYSNGDFKQQLEEVFEGDYSIQYHMAPPGLSRRDPATGLPRKRVFGALLKPVMRVLAGLRSIRGSRWDLFGYSQERRQERQLVDDYEACIGLLLQQVGRENLHSAVEIARLPAQIRGFGHIKLAAIAEVRQRLPALLDRFHGGEAAVVRIVDKVA